MFSSCTLSTMIMGSSRSVAMIASLIAELSGPRSWIAFTAV